MTASAVLATSIPELDLGDTAICRGQDLGMPRTANALELELDATVCPDPCSLLPDPSQLSALRRRVALITSAEPEAAAGLSTGIVELDAALSRRGVPRGRLTEVTGARGSGKATFIRHLVTETIARGLGAAYVDASRTLAPRDWAPVASTAGDSFWVIRPRQASKGAWCADVLLRSGAFALVVLDGAPPLARAVAVRLTRLAQDSAAALVVVGGDHAPPTLLHGALRLRVGRARQPRRASATRRAGNDPPLAPGARVRWMTITVEKGGRGQRQTVEVEYAISVAHRLCTHPEVPDRRGAARAAGSKQRSGFHLPRIAGANRPRPGPWRADPRQNEPRQTEPRNPEPRRAVELTPVG